MSEQVLSETIYKTEKGRRFYIKDYPSHQCGYIEIDTDMPHNYDDEFYENFDFWGGATFIGVCFPSMNLEMGRVLHLSAAIPINGSYLNGIIESPTLADVINMIKDEELRKEFASCRDSFWVVGFDDAHLDKCFDVPERTKRIANQIDKFQEETEK